MEKCNSLEMSILRELLFNPGSSFTNLRQNKLSSDHLSYYLRILIQKMLVNKNSGGSYHLTSLGKEFANRMDTDTSQIEKQPKVSVMVIAEKEIKGKVHLLIQRRLKEPFYSFQGFISGKIRYGETILAAAGRELKEETGLVSAKLKIAAISHELVYSKNGELLEDKIFHIVLANNISGKLSHKYEGGENYWLPQSEFVNLDKKYYSEDDKYHQAYGNSTFYREKEYIVSEF